MQSEGIKHTGPHSHISAEQESSNTSSTLKAMKMGSEEKKKKAPHSHSLTSPPPHEVGWGKNQKGRSEELRYNGLR